MSSSTNRLGGLVALVLVAALVWFLDDSPDELDAGAPEVAEASDSTAVAAVLALPVPQDDRTWRGTVEHISDGDTLIARVTDPGQTGLQVGEELRVRLLRVDTPEEERETAPAECFSFEATATLEELAPEDSTITLQWDEERQDQYGRELAHIWNEDGAWVNGELLARGAARMVTFRPNTAHDVRVTSLERTAQVTRAGLWGAC